jgi:hypothetical protein
MKIMGFVSELLDFGEVKNVSAIVSERKKVRTSIKLAGSAQTLIFVGIHFESTPIVRGIYVSVSSSSSI